MPVAYCQRNFCLLRSHITMTINKYSSQYMVLYGCGSTGIQWSRFWRYKKHWVWYPRHNMTLLMVIVIPLKFRYIPGSWSYSVSALSTRLPKVWIYTSITTTIISIINFIPSYLLFLKHLRATYVIRIFPWNIAVLFSIRFFHIVLTWNLLLENTVIKLPNTNNLAQSVNGEIFFRTNVHPIPRVLISRTQHLDARQTQNFRDLVYFPSGKMHYWAATDWIFRTVIDF